MLLDWRITKKYMLKLHKSPWFASSNKKKKARRRGHIAYVKSTSQEYATPDLSLWGTGMAKFQEM